MRAEQRLHARQILFRFTQTLERFRLSGGQLKPQPENGFGQFLLLGFQFVYACFTDLFNAPSHLYSPPARLTNLVGMGSLCEATPNASRAVVSSTPAISNRIRPG